MYILFKHSQLGVSRTLEPTTWGLVQVTLPLSASLRKQAFKVDNKCASGSIVPQVLLAFSHTENATATANPWVLCLHQSFPWVNLYFSLL